MLLMAALTAFSYFDWLKPYLFVAHTDAWMNLFRQPIYWHPIRKALVNYAEYIVVLTGLAWWAFRRKDVLS